MNDSLHRFSWLTTHRKISSDPRACQWLSWTPTRPSSARTCLKLADPLSLVVRGSTPSLVYFRPIIADADLHEKGTDKLIAASISSLIKFGKNRVRPEAFQRPAHHDQGAFGIGPGLLDAYLPATWLLLRCPPQTLGSGC